uniref:Ran gtpase-activating protein n=1 Tax=Rhipicephalus pulchellus TaxID=72859 RepID=L7M5C8_RHIPC
MDSLTDALLQCRDSEALVTEPRDEMDSDGCGEPTPEKAARFYVDDRVQYVREFLASKGVDFDRPCSYDSDGDCWLSGALPAWNKILSPVCVELIELRPATLCLHSIDMDSKGNTSVEALNYGAYLFMWLPEQHACVQSICLVESLLFKKPAFALKLALASSARLRHLTLKGGYSTPFSERDLSDGMAALKALETFEFLKLDITSRDLARDIAALLRENGRHLAKVRFERNDLSQRSTTAILKALLKCQALSELSFDDNHLNKGNIEILAAVVRSLRNLRKLTLRYSISEGGRFGPIAKALESNTSLEELSLKACQIQFELLFEALRTNTTLKVLDLDSCTMTYSEVRHLATALTFNKGLRTVLLPHCSLEDEGTVELANAMAKNDTLEKLDLLYNRCGARAVMAFCRSLTNNHSLRSVDLELTAVSDQERRELSHQLSQHDCYGRIALPWVDADLTPLTIALKADAHSLRELDLGDVEEFSRSLLCSLFDGLASNTMVRALRLEARHYDCHLGKALRNALISNQSIKSLEFELGMNSFEGSFISDVCKALLVNTAVVELTLIVIEIGLSPSKLFAQMLRENRALTSITLFSRHFETKRVEMISRGLIENNVVTSFVSRTLPRNRAGHRIREAIGRNIGLLNLAAKFVTWTTLTKRSAEAFETLRVAPSFVLQLSKVTGMSEQEALAAIEAADRYIRSQYLYLTGIVKFSVKCHPSTQTQVDALDDYCWQAIAQFLKVSDVRDE